MRVEPGAFACPRDGTLILSDDENTSERTVMAFGLIGAREEEEKTLIQSKVVVKAPTPAKPAKSAQKPKESSPPPRPASSRPQPARPPPPPPEPITAATREALESKTAAAQSPALAGSRDPLIGTKVGDYLVEAIIGEGGVGLVYRATQPEIGKTVAIKVLKHEVAENQDEIKRLLAEAKAVNAIRHRGIIDVFGFGKLKNGQQFIVMEFLEGAPLDEIIDQRAPMEIGEVLDILAEVLSALGAAHKAGVVHRDLKPNNIFHARQPDGTQYVKLLDFGLAKQGSVQGASVPQTRIHVAVGTPEYIAPEQACGMPVSPKTDLYALGAVAFEMLTGTRPFRSKNPLELLAQHVEEPAPTMASRGAEMPDELEDLIGRLLAKEPNDRPQSAEAVREELLTIGKALRNTQTKVHTRPGVVPSASLGAEAGTQARSGGGAGKALIILLVLGLLGAGGAYLFLRYRDGLSPFDAPPFAPVKAKAAPALPAPAVGRAPTAAPAVVPEAGAAAADPAPGANPSPAPTAAPAP